RWRGGNRLVNAGPRAGLRQQPHDSSRSDDRRAAFVGRRPRYSTIRPCAVDADTAQRSDVMCTVSIVPDGDRFTLMSNRDERRGRAVALQPTVATFGARAAIVPIDPVGGGSWLGVNDAGLVAALLNRHAAPQPD